MDLSDGMRRPVPSAGCDTLPMRNALAFLKVPVFLREGMTANECRLANAELDANFLAKLFTF